MADVKIGHMENAPEWYGLPLKEQHFEWSVEKDLYCGCSVDDHIVLDGDFDAVEAELKVRVAEAKKYPKHFQALGVLDYWTPMEYVDKLFDMTKKMAIF